jgi:hypothetical protein
VVQIPFHLKTHVTVALEIPWCTWSQGIMPVMTQKMCHGPWFQLIWTQNVFCDVVEMTPDGGHLHDAVELVAYFATMRQSVA